MSRKKRRNQKSTGFPPAGPPVVQPTVPLTPSLGQSAGSASPQPKVEVQTPGAVATATAPEHQPGKDEPSKPGRWLPAPLAVLDADYSQVLRMLSVSYLIVISAVVGALVFGWYLSSIFVPLLIALALAYMLNPLVESLERRGVSRMRAVILLFLAGPDGRGHLVCRLAREGRSKHHQRNRCRALGVRGQAGRVGGPMERKCSALAQRGP